MFNKKWNKSVHFSQVSIPIGADQFANWNECERLGFGANIPFYSLTEEKLGEAVNKILSDHSYKNR